MSSKLFYNIFRSSVPGYCGAMYCHICVSENMKFDSIDYDPEKAALQFIERLELIKNYVIFTNNSTLDILKILPEKRKELLEKYIVWKVGEDFRAMIPKHMITRKLNRVSAGLRTQTNLLPEAVHHHNQVGYYHLYSFFGQQSRDEVFIRSLYRYSIDGQPLICAIKHYTRYSNVRNPYPIGCVASSLYNIARDRGMPLHSQHKWFLLEKPDAWVCFPFPVFSNPRYICPKLRGYRGKAESLMFLVVRQEDATKLPIVEIL